MRERELVDKLHAAIDRKFAENEHKGTWKNMSNEECRGKLFLELNELFTSVEDGDFDNAILEVADVALYGAFFADQNRTIRNILCDIYLDKSNTSDITK